MKIHSLNMWLSGILFLFMLNCNTEITKEKEQQFNELAVGYEFEKLCIYSLNATCYVRKYRYPDMKNSRDSFSFLCCQLTMYQNFPKITPDSTVFGFQIEKDGLEVIPIHSKHIIDMLCFKADTLNWIGIRENLIVNYQDHDPYKNALLWQKIFATPDQIDPWLLRYAQKLKGEGKIRLK
jgi:hypothetical protein